MRLGFHYHIPALKANGQIRTMGLLGRFVDSVAKHCESVTRFQHTPLPNELQRMDYTLQEKNIRFVGLGPHDSIPRRILRYPKIKNILYSQRNEIDAMLIRGPSPLLPEIANTFNNLPIIFLLVGDYTEGIEDLPQPRWRKEIIRVWSTINKKRQTMAAKSHLTLVNSRKLYNELRPTLVNIVETRTTTLSDKDFYERKDTCQGSPYRLLYTGRMAHAKGLLDMVKALAILTTNGFDAILDLVGWPADGDKVLDEVFSLSKSLDIPNRIHFHGYKPVGPELFAYYKNADIYLIASRGSFEGFPRTIWEAMSHSLPVIATRVGSIPDFIDGHALLVDPANPKEIANAIKLLIQTPTMRQELILNGRELARKNTLEYQTRIMMDEIIGWVTSYAKKTV